MTWSTPTSRRTGITSFAADAGGRLARPGARRAGPPLTAAELTRLRAGSWCLSQVMLGFHECDSCPAGAAPYRGNGEYHYIGRVLARFVDGGLAPGLRVEELPGTAPLGVEWARQRGGRSQRGAGSQRSAG